MGLSILKIEKFFEVPERVRNEIKNVAEKVKGGYVLFETRPRWDDERAPWTKSAIAKFIFHKPSGNWKIYWMRASGKWEFYDEYKTFTNALKAVAKDKYGCFWG